MLFFYIKFFSINNNFDDCQNNLTTTNIQRWAGCVQFVWIIIIFSEFLTYFKGKSNCLITFNFSRTHNENIVYKLFAYFVLNRYKTKYLKRYAIFRQEANILTCLIYLFTLKTQKCILTSLILVSFTLCASTTKMSFYLLLDYMNKYLKQRESNNLPFINTY